VPVIVARETHDRDTVPGWIDVDADRGRILVHQRPVREQITVPIQEQLIVEYYSKI
jgi:small subunit ribosomal protein S4